MNDTLFPLSLNIALMLLSEGSGFKLLYSQKMRNTTIQNDVSVNTFKTKLKTLKFSKVCFLEGITHPKIKMDSLSTPINKNKLR